MTWVTILRLVLGVASKLAGYVKDKQLIDAGKAEQAVQSLEAANVAIRDAQRARRNVSHDPDSVRDDSYNRD